MDIEEFIPVYKQIMLELELDILQNIYKKGEKLPSVRELSIKLKANPNTIQKALNELENINLITTKRTTGKFVTEDNSKIEEIRKSIADNNITLFLKSMEKIGYSSKEIKNLIKERI